MSCNFCDDETRPDGRSEGYCRWCKRGATKCGLCGELGSGSEYHWCQNCLDITDGEETHDLDFVDRFENQKTYQVDLTQITFEMSNKMRQYLQNEEQRDVRVAARAEVRLLAEQVKRSGHGAVIDVPKELYHSVVEELKREREPVAVWKMFAMREIESTQTQGPSSSHQLESPVLYLQYEVSLNLQIRDYKRRIGAFGLLLLCTAWIAGQSIPISVWPLFSAIWTIFTVFMYFALCNAYRKYRDLTREREALEVL